MSKVHVPANRVTREFWSGRRVFLTGHTGFKGCWLAAWLSDLGATVRGYSLPPESGPSMFEAARADRWCEHVVGDVRDLTTLRNTMRDFAPQVVFHLAAQALVRRSYRQPVDTYASNVQGTVHVLEACRQMPSLEAIVVITTDKVYQDMGRDEPHKETDPLGGHDPYSASKACAEIVTSSYRQSFFTPTKDGTATNPRLASARAGNVIGGGDWNEDRLIPDAVRAFSIEQPLAVRNPESVRPWQWVLEPLAGYLMLARALTEGRPGIAAAYNFGPSHEQVRTVRDVITSFAGAWSKTAGWAHTPEASAPKETGRLYLDSKLANETLGWLSRVPLETSLAATAHWYKVWAKGASPDELAMVTLEQIRAFSAEAQLGA